VVDETADEQAEAPIEAPAEAPAEVVVPEDGIEDVEPTQASDADEPSDVTPAPVVDNAPIVENAPIAETLSTDAAEHVSPPASLVENLPVVTEDDYFVIAPGATLTVAAPGILHNDSDPEKDPFTVQQGANTTLHGNTWFTGTQGQFGFTAQPGFVGTEVLTYFAQDAGHDATTGTIYVTVQDNVDSNENHWPDTLPDTYTTPQDEPLSIPSHLGVLANDTDPDGDLITTQAVGPIATYNGGTVIIDADGSFYYTPPAGFIGEDAVGYVAYDTFGGGSWGTLIISVTPPGTVPAGPNAAPVALDDVYFTPVNVPLQIDALHGALVNDHDPEGTALTASTYNWGKSQAGGVGTVATDGSFIYVAPVDVTAQSQDYFTYIVTDEAGLSSHASILITFTDAVGIVEEPGTDPGTGPDGSNPGEPHPGDPQPAGEGGSVGESPTPAVPSSPVIAASQTTPSSREAESLAFTGLSLWQPLGGAAAVLLLGAFGLVVAGRRRRSR
jgi:hypothetical protein